MRREILKLLTARYEEEISDDVRRRWRRKWRMRRERGQEDKRRKEEDRKGNR